MPDHVVHAFTDDALGDSDATDVAERIARKEVGAREVAEAAVRRAEAVQPQINAVAHADFDRAVRETDTARQGVFAGVPTFVKDNVDVAGLPTGHGTAAFVPVPATKNSPVVEQLVAQGLVVLGKSRLPEFGFSASTEYAEGDPVRNPWNTAYSTGASSGGSAALVASGVVPLAHANDGAGSIRIPAAACGLVGLKPSRGRLVPDPANARMPVQIATQGILTRTVRDTARFYAGAERFWREPALPAVRLVEGPGRTRLRVGLALDPIMGPGIDADTRSAVLSTADLLADLGHHIEETQLPAPVRFADDFSLYWGLLGLLVTVGGRRIFHPEFDRSRTDDLTKGLAQMCRRELARTPGMLVRLRRAGQEYRKAFTRFDVLLSPVLAHTTPLLGHLSPQLPFEELFDRLREYVAFTPLNNAAGAPGISLPLGQTATGLPIGCQLSGDVGDERTLLELAYELEAARPWRRIRDVTGHAGPT